MEDFKMAKVNFKNSLRKSSLYSIVQAEQTVLSKLYYYVYTAFLVSFGRKSYG